MTTLDAVRLRPMSAAEFPSFRASFVLDWAADIARIDDLSFADAEAQAASRTDQNLTDGPATPGHRLFVIVDGEVPVGTLWFSYEPGKPAFLDDITIREEFRGQGYGRRALELLEVEARTLGLPRIDLHVYTHNPTAIAVYQKLGYHTTGLKMRKMLRPSDV